MKVIAISKNEDLRVVETKTLYQLQNLRAVGSFGIWSDMKSTEEEWRVSKWILDLGLKVAADYPTIAEIRKGQKDD